MADSRNRQFSAYGLSAVPQFPTQQLHSRNVERNMAFSADIQKQQHGPAAYGNGPLHSEGQAQLHAPFLPLPRRSTPANKSPNKRSPDHHPVSVHMDGFPPPPYFQGNGDFSVEHLRKNNFSSSVSESVDMVWGGPLLSNGTFSQPELSPARSGSFRPGAEHSQLLPRKPHIEAPLLPHPGSITRSPKRVVPNYLNDPSEPSPSQRQQQLLRFSPRQTSDWVSRGFAGMAPEVPSSPWAPLAPESMGVRPISPDSPYRSMLSPSLSAPKHSPFSSEASAFETPHRASMSRTPQGDFGALSPVRNQLSKEPLMAYKRAGGTLSVDITSTTANAQRPTVPGPVSSTKEPTPSTTGTLGDDFSSEQHRRAVAAAAPMPEEQKVTKKERPPAQRHSATEKEQASDNVPTGAPQKQRRLSISGDALVPTSIAPTNQPGTSGDDEELIATAMLVQISRSRAGSPVMTSRSRNGSPSVLGGGMSGLLSSDVPAVAAAMLNSNRRSVTHEGWLDGLPPYHPSSSRSATPSLLEYEMLPDLIESFIAVKNRPCSIDEICVAVQKKWHLVRKPDGSTYKQECLPTVRTCLSTHNGRFKKTDDGLYSLRDRVSGATSAPPSAPPSRRSSLKTDDADLAQMVAARKRPSSADGRSGGKRMAGEMMDDEWEDDIMVPVTKRRRMSDEDDEEWTRRRDDLPPVPGPRRPRRNRVRSWAVERSPPSQARVSVTGTPADNRTSVKMAIARFDKGIWQWRKSLENMRSEYKWCRVNKNKFWTEEGKARDHAQRMMAMLTKIDESPAAIANEKDLLSKIQQSESAIQELTQELEHCQVKLEKAREALKVRQERKARLQTKQREASERERQFAMSVRYIQKLEQLREANGCISPNHLPSRIEDDESPLATSTANPSPAPEFPNQTTTTAANPTSSVTGTTPIHELESQPFSSASTMGVDRQQLQQMSTSAPVMTRMPAAVGVAPSSASANSSVAAVVDSLSEGPNHPVKISVRQPTPTLFAKALPSEPHVFPSSKHPSPE